jgi:hypothetical protein
MNSEKIGCVSTIEHQSSHRATKTDNAKKRGPFPGNQRRIESSTDAINASVFNVEPDFWSYFSFTTFALRLSLLHLTPETIEHLSSNFLLSACYIFEGPR